MSIATSSVTGYEVWVFVHILSAVIAFGWLFVFPIALGTAERSNPQNLPFFYLTVRKLLRFVLTPAMVILLATGLYLLSDGPVGFGDPWISATFAILIALFAIIGAAIIPTTSRLVKLTDDEIGNRQLPEDFQLSSDYRKAARQLKALNIATILLVLAALFLMVTQPS